MCALLTVRLVMGRPGQVSNPLEKNRGELGLGGRGGGGGRRGGGRGGDKRENEGEGRGKKAEMEGGETR